MNEAIFDSEYNIYADRFNLPDDFILISSAFIIKHIRKFIYNRDNEIRSGYVTLRAKNSNDNYLIRRDTYGILNFSTTGNYRNRDLGTLTQDVFDIIIYLCLVKPKDNEGYTRINADEILKFRNIKSVKSIYRGKGYSSRQRELIDAQIKFLSAIFIVNKKDAKNIFDLKALNNYIYSIKLNEILQTELKETSKLRILPNKILEFKSSSNAWKKVIGRNIFISITGKKRKELIKVKFLYKGLKGKLLRRPYLIKDSFENVLGALKNEKIIETWDYKTQDDGFYDTRFRDIEYWKEWILEITLTNELYQKYSNLGTDTILLNNILDKVIINNEKVKDIMQQQGLTQKELSCCTGIHESALSRFLRGLNQLNNINYYKLKNWINKL